MSKHTPWKHESTEATPNGLDELIRDERGEWIAWAYKKDHALLIAQAPRLLEALERVMDNNCPLIGSPSMDDLIDYWQLEKSRGRGEAEDMIFALEAIAAATGGQP